MGVKNVARQNTWNINSDRAASGEKLFGCGECVVGWKIINRSQGRVDDFEVCEDRHVRAGQIQSGYSAVFHFCSDLIFAKTAYSIGGSYIPTEAVQRTNNFSSTLSNRFYTRVVLEIWGRDLDPNRRTRQGTFLREHPFFMTAESSGSVRVNRWNKTWLGGIGKKQTPIRTTKDKLLWRAMISHTLKGYGI